MADVGRPSELNEELLVKIKDGILSDKNHKEIAESLGIPYDTFEGWIKRNYDSFADRILTYKHESLLRKAERNLKEFLDMSTVNQGMSMKGEKYAYKDAKLAQVKAGITTFVAETLGRQEFHKKKELDHKGEFTTYEIIDGDEDNDRPVPQATSAMAETDQATVGSQPV